VFARETVETIASTLHSLEVQDGIDQTEVVVADCSSDGTTEVIRASFPWVRHLRLEPGTMPAIKAAAIRACHGEIVAILDAHDAAQPGWLNEIRAGLASGEVAAVGGAVMPGGPPTAANRAAYLFEYGAFEPPLEQGPTSGDLPGNNVAYRRRLLVETCGDLLAAGFYKPFFHDRIRRHGGKLWLRPAMRVTHLTQHRLLDFALRRFHYGRCFGARRIGLAPVSFKIAYRLAAPAIPPLLVVRHLIRAVSHPENRKILPHAAIALVCICIAWGVGEWMGYWAGAGRSCDKVY
jgi:glycosyltransferase involved in cell wall biosynthesis